mgnify:CR=1 FL=1
MTRAGHLNTITEISRALPRANALGLCRAATFRGLDWKDLK